MKDILRLTIFLATALFYFNLNAQTNDGQQFSNYGFENWVNEGTEDVEPSHWHSFKSATGSFNNMMSQQIEPSSAKRPGSKGNRSVCIFSKKKFGVVANGNMTTGRINAGSMSPTGSENYNYTQRYSDYCTLLTVVPDSLTVWVAFRAEDSDSYASVMAAVHGDVDLKQLSSGGYDPSDKVCATAKREYLRTCDPGETLVWKRLSIPFVSGTHDDPKYILATFSTNIIPGGGDKGDEVYIDDIYLIYNPYLEIGTLDKLAYQYPVDGSALEINVPFVLSGTMSADNLNKSPNQVIAQMSDINGNFDNPYELGRMTTNESGVIHGNIPYGVPNGTGYRVRVVSTNYPMTSDDNGVDISMSGNTYLPSLYTKRLDIHPNPTSGKVMIKNVEVEFVSVYNIQGQCVGNFTTNEINLEDLSSGMYFLIVKDKEGNIITDKVVKK